MGYIEYQTTHNYVQFPGALYEFKRYTHNMGKNFLVVTACGPITEEVKRRIMKSVESSMSEMLNPELAPNSTKYRSYFPDAQRYDEEPDTNINVTFMDFEKRQITVAAVEELAAFIKENNVDAIVGIGGGRGMDFARAVSRYVNCQAILVPTNPSTNASTSQISVIYNEDGTISAAWRRERMQDLIIVDTDFIYQAPPRFFIAGIADSLCSFYESRQNLQFTEYWKHIPYLSVKALDQYIDIMEKYAIQAVEDFKAGKVTRELESIVSLLLYCDGPVRMGISVGFAHLFDEAMLKFEPCKKLPHGICVGYATILLKVFGKESLEEIHRYIDFCRALDIPVCFDDLGISDVTREQLLEACEYALQGPTAQMFPIKVTAEEIVNVAYEAEKIAKEYLNK